MKIFDSTLKTLERSLDVRLARHNVLAGNLANVDTPGYKPKDVDFAAAMSSAGGDGPGTIALTSPGHMASSGAMAIGGSDGDVPVLETSGEAPGLDGNGVDLDRTMATLAENGMQYGASARAASKKLAILRYAAGDGQG
jgi:flagellar basal-body rod protein FlgB